MVSPSKVSANRTNALRSTGPKTASGKATSSRNALKHGLLSRQGVLPDENPAELENLRDRLLADLCPCGELESVLVERIILAAWRLRRAVRLEAIVVRTEKAALESMRGRQGTSAEADLSLAFVRDARETNQLERLRRYEVTLERSLFSSMHELERLQRRRAGEETPAPVAAEVNVRTEIPEPKT